MCYLWLIKYIKESFERLFMGKGLNCGFFLIRNIFIYILLFLCVLLLSNVGLWSM